LRHLPNLICLARIALIWPIVAALGNANYDFALLLFAVAAVSDGLDGFLAKRFGWTSELGKILDPAADKLLLISVFVMATSLGLVPWWVAVTAVTRDVAIILAAIVLRIWSGPLEGRPSIISKINTLLQLIYLLGVITHAAGYGPPQGFLATLAVVTVITTLLSGVNYALDFARVVRGISAKTP
jgi:cardiolipin synthase